MKRILWISDGVAKTGFSTVAHNIIKNLSKEEFDVHHLAVNYMGDPHNEWWKIYPASLGGDIWGFNRVKNFGDAEFDGIFILNDVWVISKYLTEIKKHFKKIPPIIVYFPVDSKFLDPDWFDNFDVVSKVVLYTEFGKSEVLKSRPDLEDKLEVVPHGVDTSLFFKMDKPKVDTKKIIYGDRDEYTDSFIALSAQRNQPRKRLDISVEGFALFAHDKPKNVKLYLHCGTKDAGWYLPKLALRYGIHDRLIVTSQNSGIQQIPEEGLNIIYNATDVGINTSLGEGWSLTNHEHAATGAPQIVPDHSALTELYKDVGILMPIYGHQINNDTLTMGMFVSPDALAESLQLLYTNKVVYDKSAKLCHEKFSSEYYNWKNIVNNSWYPIFMETFK